MSCKMQWKDLGEGFRVPGAQPTQTAQRVYLPGAVLGSEGDFRKDILYKGRRIQQFPPISPNFKKPIAADHPFHRRSAPKYIVIYNRSPFFSADNLLFVYVVLHYYNGLVYKQPDTQYALPSWSLFKVASGQEVGNTQELINCGTSTETPGS